MATDRKVTATVTSENGFYVGDVCYQMSNEDYEADWHKADYSDFEGEHELRGHKFAIGGTKYGDGEYGDNYRHEYGVDSGTLGILPLALCEDKTPEKLNELGRFVEAKTATFYADDGLFEIRFDTGLTIEIDTSCDEENKDEEDENY